MRALIYEGVGLSLLASSPVAFYESIDFLSKRDYVAGLAVLAIGFFVLRTGAELSKLAILVRREASE